jgi:hypothetical protein
MDDAEFLRIYPRVLLVPERGLFPVVDLPANYRKLVPGFYAVRGREKVDEYAARVQQRIGFDVRLRTYPNSPVALHVINPQAN